jgi:hypothetical protein
MMSAAMALGFPVVGVSCTGFTRVSDQTYLGASYNWTFRDSFPNADRLFNAFDYGHAIVYDYLARDAGHATDASTGIEGREFEFITKRLLVHPPKLPLEERAIGPHYAALVPELVTVFEWAHQLHRQLYDVLADPRTDSAGRDARVSRVLRYYASRRDLALSMAPKSMDLMEGAPYSLAFRRQDPKFNGLLWSYHWYQMAIYDALLAGSDETMRRQNVAMTTARFWQLLGEAPAHMPTVMPSGAVVAPHFAERYPEAAIIFDNLHALHDVVADILASPVVLAGDKRAAILRAMRAYQDSTTAVVSRDAWRSMADAMGVEHMGGAAPIPRQR